MPLVLPITVLGTAWMGEIVPPFSLHPFLPSPKKSSIFCLFREKEKTNPESKRMMREEKMRERIPVD